MEGVVASTETPPSVEEVELTSVTEGEPEPVLMTESEPEPVLVTESEPEPASMPELVPQTGEGQVLAALADLQERLEAMSASFETKIKYDAVKERVIDELHHELQGYREDLAFKLMRPLFLDLIGMHDDMSSILRHAPTDENTEPAQVIMIDNLRSFQSTIEEILTRQGIDVYTEVGDVFVPGRQRATKMIVTEEPELHMKLIERLRKGFAYGSRMLRPEMVTVYSCVTGASTSSASTKGEAS